MRRHPQAIRGVLAATVVLFATACSGPSESPEAQANQPSATGAATASPTPTELPCVVGGWKFVSATHDATADWWQETGTVALSGSAGSEDLRFSTVGTYSFNTNVTLASAGSPLKELRTSGTESGKYRLSSGSINFAPDAGTMMMRSFEDGEQVAIGPVGHSPYAATFTCEGDKLTLRRDSGRLVTEFARG